MTPLLFADIERLTGGRFGVFDVACPNCGPGRRTPANRTRGVLRVWHEEPAFATYHCTRCGLSGYARGGGGVGGDSRALRRPVRMVGLEHRAVKVGVDGDHGKRQSEKAARLWRCRHPAEGTPVENYLRCSRGYYGPLPATIGFLPASKPKHHPAMIAAFGVVTETEPGVVVIAPKLVRGVHLTLLKPDGSGKADVSPNKLMVGPSSGWPIILAPPNDLLGLAIVEGIETGLSIHEATGLGVWAAGAAGRMPALADKVPDCIDTVTIAAEPDDAGREGARRLADRLRDRGLHCELRILGDQKEAA